MKSNPFFIVSRFDEDISWIIKYSKNYIIYNKGEKIDKKFNSIDIENIGGNQRDIAHFAYFNYFNLPNIMIFCQAEFEPHCKKTIFDKLIQNTEFTSLEYYGSTPANGWENRDENGQFKEINNSWYIKAHNETNHQSCRYFTFDEFMNKYFEDYQPLDWIRFAPGSQYLVPKQNILQYPRQLWGDIMNELNALSCTESHIVERALWHILNGTYQAKKEYYL
jgi:hypothetical protein